MSQEHLQNHLFPIFLKLREVPTLLVGGGNVGLEKLEALLKNDAEALVHIVAPEIREEIQELAKTHQGITLEFRAYEPSDLDNFRVAILATDQPELHKEIKALALIKKVLVNVADTPDLCDFYLGSTVKKGALKIGISTNGQSPTLAKRIRELLEEVLPDDTPQLLKNLKAIRDRLKGDFEFKVNKLNDITTKMLKDDE